MEGESTGRLEIRYLVGDTVQGSLSMPLDESVVSADCSFWELTATVLETYRKQLKRRAEIREAARCLGGKAG